MSRKHAHRADNAPASRRYVRSVVQRARDEIISAIVHERAAAVPFPVQPGETIKWYGPGAAFLEDRGDS